MASDESDPSLSRNLSSTRLNAKAAEFVPRSADPAPTFMYHKPPPTAFFHAQPHVHNQRAFTQQYVPVLHYHHHHQKQLLQQPVSINKTGGEVNKSEITDEAMHKLINQVLILLYLYVYLLNSDCLLLFNVEFELLIVVFFYYLFDF